MWPLRPQAKSPPSTPTGFGKTAKAAACAVALLGLVGAVRGLRVWGGPSSRYEVADAGGPVAGPRGERVASAWDELSAGRDPTDVGPDQRP